MPETTFTFTADPRFAPLLLLAGVTPSRSRVVVDATHVRARFGVCRFETPRSNVASASVTGPYRWWRGIGVRVSLADRGLTFGSALSGGACLQLLEPVSMRVGPVTVPLRHPGITLTVTDPQALVDVLESPDQPPSVPPGV